MRIGGLNPQSDLLVGMVVAHAKIEGRQDTCQRSLHVAFSALQGSPFYMPTEVLLLQQARRDDDTRLQNYRGADNNRSKVTWAGLDWWACNHDFSQMA